MRREGNRRTRKKPSEHGENQQQTQYTGIERQLHWWEASALTSASPLLPGQDVPQYNLNIQVIIGLRFQFGRLQGWSQLHKPFVQFGSCRIHCPCITRIFPVLDSVLRYRQYSTVLYGDRELQKDTLASLLLLLPQCSIPVCNPVGDRELEKKVPTKVPLAFGVFRVFTLHPPYCVQKL